MLVRFSHGRCSVIFKGQPAPLERAMLQTYPLGYISGTWKGINHLESPLPFRHVVAFSFWVYRMSVTEASGAFFLQKRNYNHHPLPVGGLFALGAEYPSRFLEQVPRRMAREQLPRPPVPYSSFLFCGSSCPRMQTTREATQVPLVVWMEFPAFNEFRCPAIRSTKREATQVPLDCPIPFFFGFLWEFPPGQCAQVPLGEVWMGLEAPNTIRGIKSRCSVRG